MNNRRTTLAHAIGAIIFCGALGACASHERQSGDAPAAVVVAPADFTTPEGLIVLDLVVGAGEPCPEGAEVTVRYTGMLADGTVFDSTDSRGRPMTFELARLIRGWQEGVPGMRVGGVRRLTIPYPLAYGETGRPPRIPPRATLTFEIELLGFEHAGR